MKRSIPLTKKAIEAIQSPGIHSVGGNLYLKVNDGGARSWVFRYFHDQKRRHMGLGSTALVPLERARDAVIDALRLLRAGTDPLDEKHGAEQKRAPKASTITLAAVLDLYIAKTKSEWKPGADRVWRMEAEKYFVDLLPRPVASIGDDEVMDLLQPQWLEKTVTLMRIRGKLESLLGYATANKWREGPNPAAWKGLLEHKLAKPKNFLKVKNNEALEPREMPDFVAKLRKVDKVVARLAEFTILCAVRGDEARLARWEEVDLDKKVWVCPAERMKTKKQHTVPLSTAAVTVLGGLPRSGEFIFANPATAQAPGHAAALELLKRVAGRESMTLHGARSSFRDWAGDLTNYPKDLVEECLAHSTKTATEKAYRRSDALEKRRVIMQSWADFIAKPAGDNVLPMQRQK